MTKKLEEEFEVLNSQKVRYSYLAFGSMRYIDAIVTPSFEFSEILVLRKRLRPMLEKSGELIVERMTNAKRFSLEEILEAARAGRILDSEMRSQFWYFPDDSIELQLSLVSSFGYPEFGVVDEARVARCQALLTRIYIVSPFHMLVVNPGVQLSFDEKIPREKVSEFIKEYYSFLKDYSAAEFSLERYLKEIVRSNWLML